MEKLEKARPKTNFRTEGHGAYEWAPVTFNCCTGCSNDCLYCYAKGMAVRFKQVTPAEWFLQRIRPWDVNKKHKKYDGWVMFPSSHDITPSSLEACMAVLDNLLKAGNRVLIVSKPQLECIKAICEKFNPFKDRVLFRFTIGAQDDELLSFWEPYAPPYAERKASLQHAFNEGFGTSVSVEPMLDSDGIDALISDLSPYVTQSIWVGTMNHLGRLEKHADAVLKEAMKRIREGQTVAKLKAIYQRHKDNPMICWKKEIRKILGI